MPVVSVADRLLVARLLAEWVARGTGCLSHDWLPDVGLVACGSGCGIPRGSLRNSTTELN